MTRKVSALSRTGGRPDGWGRVLVPLLIVLAVSGCETLERMDYLDRFFEPGLRQGPVFAAEPQLNPPVAPATDAGFQPGSVVALEPRPDPADAPATDWRAQPPGSVVAMEPRLDPPAASAGNRNLQAGRVRVVEPQADAVPAPEADPEARTRSLVRQNQWLTRFWMELTPAQQSRVVRQLRTGDVVLAAENTEPAAAWDSMGLADRAKLIFGSGRPLERPAPSERRDGSTWARSS